MSLRLAAETECLETWMAFGQIGQSCDHHPRKAVVWGNDNEPNSWRRLLPRLCRMAREYRVAHRAAAYKAGYGNAARGHCKRSILAAQRDRDSPRQFDARTHHMSAHPDTAWSPWYASPVGVDGEPCRHYGIRMRVGPTSRKRTFMILVDNCARCGRILRSARDLSWKEYEWVRRSNARSAHIKSARPET